MFNGETGVGDWDIRILGMGIGKVFYSGSLLSLFQIPFAKGWSVENRIVFSLPLCYNKKKAARTDSLFEYAYTSISILNSAQQLCSPAAHHWEGARYTVSRL